MTRYYIFKGYKGYKQHVVDNFTRPKQFQTIPSIVLLYYDSPLLL